MEEEIQERGITFGEIFRTIFSQKWLALILAAVIFVGGTVGLYLYGKFTTEYSVTFVVQLPDSDNSPASFVYPDGKTYYYSDLISSENLNEIKESDEAYKNIDVAEMLRRGKISVSRVVTETDTNTGKSDATYTVKAASKYFDSADIARSFLTDIAYTPYNYISGMHIDYDMYLTSAKETSVYDLEFDFLEKQVKYLQAIYDSYIETYGTSFVVGEGKTLLSYKSALDAFIQNGTISSLKTRASTAPYIKDKTFDYATAADEIDRQLKIEQQTLDILLGMKEGGSSSIIITWEEVSKQSQSVGELKQRKENYLKYENGTYNEAFAKSVSETENKVEELTKDFAKVSNSIFVKSTSVSFTNANIMKSESKIGLVLAVLISLVAALVIAAVVAYIIGAHKNKKLAAGTAAPAQPEAEEQKAQ